MTALRCLLFSSKADTAPPIWQVLAELGIEGEHCQSAVDAVERVTTQQFQIVITDWEDQPEAAFLLRTARELKAAQRPITLAIVSGEARLPEALQAGANSVLMKPIRAEQVRETIGTACELLRSKLPATPTAVQETVKMAMAAAATGSPGSQQAGAHISVEPTIGQPSANPAPREEKKTEVAESETEASSTAAKPEVLTGWAMLQARLTKSAPVPEKAKASPRSDLLTYDNPMYRPPKEAPAKEEHKVLKKIEPRPESAPEAALFSYMSGEAAEKSFPHPAGQPDRSKLYMVAAVAVLCIALGAVPRTRQILRNAYQGALRASSGVLNPPPAPMPPAIVTHETFGQASDDYKFPAVGNIPDATTDPSQIQVLPVVDPTAKPPKNVSGTNSDQVPPPDSSAEANPASANQVAPDSSTSSPKDTVPAGALEVPGPSAEGTSDGPRPHIPPVPAPRVQAPMQSTIPNGAPSQVSAIGGSGIPSSLRSQIGSSVPQNSGAKPIEAAMSSIEPVRLPELVERQFLLQPVDPVYPAAAKAGAQRGSVTLEVLVGRDGLVQDAKFLQGSLVFARSAIDSVRQWRFKPYILNGHAVSVQSVMTLNFKPPA